MQKKEIAVRDASSGWARGGVQVGNPLPVFISGPVIPRQRDSTYASSAASAIQRIEVLLFFLLCVGRLLTFALFVCRSFVLRIFPSPRASKSSFHLYKFFSAHHFIVCRSNIYVLFPPPSGERKKEDLPQWFPLPKGGDIYNIIPTPNDIDFFAQISKLHNTHSPDRRH